MSATEVEPTPGPKRTALEAAKLNGNVQGKLFVITGAYSGIGVETTKALLAEGGKVVVGGRNCKLQEEFVEQLKKDYDDDRIDEHIIDLGDLESVKDFAVYVSGKYKSIDVLICNAGIMNTPPGVTKDGFEQQMGVNVIGHFCWPKSWLTKPNVRSGSHRVDTSSTIVPVLILTISRIFPWTIPRATMDGVPINRANSVTFSWPRSFTNVIPTSRQLPCTQVPFSPTWIATRTFGEWLHSSS